MSPRPRGCSAVGSASPCQGEGREFESRHPLECELGGNIPGCTGIDPNTVTWPRGEAAACKAVYTGSNPVVTSADSYGVQRFSLEIRAIGAAVARFPDTEEVTGSIPVSRTEVLWPPGWVAVFVSDCVCLLCIVGPNGCSPSAFGPSLHTCAIVHCAKWASTRWWGSAFCCPRASLSLPAPADFPSLWCAKWARTVLVVLRLGRLWPLGWLFTVQSGPERGCGGCGGVWWMFGVRSGPQRCAWCVAGAAVVRRGKQREKRRVQARRWV